MNYLDFIKEGVVLNGTNNTIAYAVVVAEAYDAMPISSPDAQAAYSALSEHNVEVLFKRLSGSIKVEFDENDPYAALTDDPAMMVRYMLYDMLVNKRLRIFSGHADHPSFTPKENVIFEQCMIFTRMPNC
jgi:hypothetical protein